METLRHFIDTHKEYIDNNDFSSLYSLLPISIKRSALTDLLFKAEINPLNYMKYIPPNFLSDSRISEFELPEHIDAIGARAFSNCFYLKDLKLNSKLEAIHDNAFYQCVSLKSIILPPTLRFLMDEAFAECICLKEINLPGSIKEISPHCFSGCLSLEIVNIEEGVEEILKNAFHKCERLKEVNLPKSVKYIENNIFSNCSSDYIIYYNGTIEDWYGISGCSYIDINHVKFKN